MWGIQIVGDSEQVGAWGWGFEVRNGGGMGKMRGVGSGGRKNEVGMQSEKWGGDG